MDHDEFYEKPSLEDVQHYGVLGMKWGVHKNPEKAYSKAIDKLEKLDANIAKKEQKAFKAQKKFVRRQRRAKHAILFKDQKYERASRSIKKANKKYRKAQMATVKAKRWYDAVEKAFKDVNIASLDPSKTDVGKKYVDMKLNQIVNNARTATSVNQLISYYSRKAG